MEDSPVGCPGCLRLEAEIAVLKAQVRELTERLNRDSSNSSKPPSSDSPYAKPAPPKPKSGRKRGGQPGHQRFKRALAPSELVTPTDHRPSCCERCGTVLAGDDPDPKRHQIAEVPPIRPEVVEHRLHRLTCGQCGHATKARLPAAVPKGHFGPRLASALTMWSAGYRVGKRGVQRLAKDLFGLEISLGMVSKLERGAATALAAPVAEVKERIREESVNIDETSWRQGRELFWLWGLVGKAMTLFQITAKRDAATAQKLLGKDYAKTATRDRLNVYDWIGRSQWCWAHARRDFQAMIGRDGMDRLIGEELMECSNVLFARWNLVRDGTIKRHSMLTGAGLGLRRRFRAGLEYGIRYGGAKTAATCGNMLAGEANWWRFARTEGVEPTNNAAERSLRHGVIWRKVSGGTASEEGSRFVERMLTLVETCRQQGRNLLETLTACFRASWLGGPSVSLLPT